MSVVDFIQACGSNFSDEIKSAILSGHMFEGWLSYLKSSPSTFWLNAPVRVSVGSVLPLLSLAPQSGLRGQLRSQRSSIVWVHTLSNGFCGLGQSGPVITPENCGPRVLLITKSHQPWLSTECSRLWGETYKKKNLFWHDSDWFQSYFNPECWYHHSQGWNWLLQVWFVIFSWKVASKDSQ